ncbi:RimK/LysX family protein [Desulfococcaceae bacterium OttesenSCG-928-F15]|nr:RimK/LysX family protein [Desulfococcaceae bacterium OttesenSCG-928-F15]
MKSFSASAFFNFKVFFLFIFPFMFTTACTLHTDDDQTRRTIRQNLLESQKKHSEELAYVRQLSEDNALQYESLFLLLQDILKNEKEQQKSIAQIRNLLSEYEGKGQNSKALGRLQASASAKDAPKKVVGGIEAVRLVPPDIVLLARVDTGAETASLDARNIRLFERDGDRWVRFDTPAPKGDKMISMEQKLSRKTRILQASADGSEQRLVIELSITIGGITQLAEFTLTNREHLTFPVLIGRNILKDIMVVDVSLPTPSIP